MTDRQKRVDDARVAYTRAVKAWGDALHDPNATTAEIVSARLTMEAHCEIVLMEMRGQ